MCADRRDFLGLVNKDSARAGLGASRPRWNNWSVIAGMNGAVSRSRQTMLSLTVRRRKFSRSPAMPVSVPTYLSGMRHSSTLLERIVTGEVFILVLHVRQSVLC